MASSPTAARASRRALPLFIIAEATSLFGNSAIAIVLPWLVLARTGDPALTGLVATVSAVPSFAATLISGHLIDKVGRRRMSVLADIGSAMSVAGLIVVDLAVGLDVFWFIVLGLLGALFDVPGMTARETLLPNVAKSSGVALEKVAGMRQVAYSLAMLAGPGLAGLLLAALPAIQVVGITAACSAVAAVCMALLPRSATALAPATVEDDGHAGALGGWRFVRTRPGLFAVLLVSLAIMVPVAPLMAVILPAHFTELGRPELLGAALSANAVGSLVGSVLYAGLARRRVMVWTLGMGVFALSLGVIAPLAFFWSIAAGMALAGVAGGLMGPVAMVALSEHVPDRVRGRVMALFSAGSMAAAPVGLGLVSLVLAGSDIGVGAWICFLAFVPIAAFAMLSPGVRSFVQRPTDSEEVAGADDQPTGDVRVGDGAHDSPLPPDRVAG
ncbi:MFS transporter [Microlunatus sp. Y2014]|uniref:MFS transporter n=1 Tax=Microlunatus sp. Y2014 TaxID=3418488 RepID=UPI003DA702D7